MNKKNFIEYCWARDFKYIEVVRVAHQKDIECIPTRVEYEAEYDRLTTTLNKWLGGE